MALFDRLKRIFGAGRNGGSEPGGELIPCHEALRFIHEFIDGELDDVSRAEVEAHFDVCQRCYPHLRLERAYRAALRRSAARETAPPELRERVLSMVSEGPSDV
jgi:anti-sigma factor (TIGR02949 family)